MSYKLHFIISFQVLLPVASLLQMTEVRVACSDFLKKQLDPSNCLGIRRFADVHGCMDLLAGAHTYTEQHFSEIVHGEEFLNLPAMQICELISSDQLTVPSEEKVCACLNSSLKIYVHIFSTSMVSKSKQDRSFLEIFYCRIVSARTLAGPVIS